MAVVTFNTPQDMSSSATWEGNLTGYSNSYISIANGTHSATYYGSFTFDSNGLTGGTVTGYTEKTNGVEDFTITGASANALTVDSLLNSTDEFALDRYIFSGADTMNGSTGNDYIIGWGGIDTLRGNAGNDYIKGGSGNDNVDGGEGIDTAVYSGNSAYYTVTRTATGYTVTDRSGTEGTDTLTNIERLQFTDQILAVDINGNAGKIYRLYQAAFNRPPDNSGLKYWINAFDSGVSFRDIAASFEKSVEYQNLYGSNLSNDGLVNALYAYALHRTPDQIGHDYWVSQLNAGATSRENLIMDFSESTENQAAVVGTIGGGIHLT